MGIRKRGDTRRIGLGSRTRMCTGRVGSTHTFGHGFRDGNKL